MINIAERVGKAAKSGFAPALLKAEVRKICPNNDCIKMNPSYTNNKHWMTQPDLWNYGMLKAI